MRSRLSRLFEPVDIASLVFFRIAFGAIMVWEVGRYFHYGWIERYYITPTFHFKYYGFEWVRAWSGNGMYIHFAVLGILALCIMIGLFYRLVTVLFFFGFTYVFLLDQANYLNHFYLISLLSLIMIFIPAHRLFSLDVLCNPRLCATTVPRWTLWLLRFQIGVPYFYGGLAKVNGDWLQGEPMRMWLTERTDFPVIGHLFTEEWMVYLFSYGGLLFDLLIVPLLFWKQTRWFALGVAVAFHLMNAHLFSIGIFPYLMIAATLMFFPPDWPRRLLRWKLPPVNCQTAAIPSLKWQRLIVTVLGLYAVWQLLFPLRHFLYPGDVSWTEEGHRFAWHMKLRDKRSQGAFYVSDPSSGTRWEADPRNYLARHQVDEMLARPDMILQFSHYLAEEAKRQGYDDVEVRGMILVSLNGQPARLIVNPDVNLAAQQRSLLAADWILFK